MSKDSWDRARLIPTSGINGADEQERRAVSVLLAVIGGVREFGRAMTQPLGAPAGVIETFTGVSFGVGERLCLPDGLIQVRHGRRTWTALIEVRTAAAGLDSGRLRTLVDVAHDQGFDAVLAISGEAVPASGPAVDQRILREVVLQHYSWGQVLAQAVAQRERAVAQAEGIDPDQAWVLAELIRYLEHPRSGAGVEPAVRLVRGVQLAPDEAALRPEPSEPVLEVDLREPPVTVLHTVLIAEPAGGRQSPPLPSRREVRLVRRLGAGAQSAADAGWYQDPHDTGQLRWWDGVGWSECTYPGQPALA
jgi:hypothetical protein